jgi:predicted permease
MSLLANLRFGVRSLLRQPGLTAVATLALTLGIGLTTVMFSIIQGAFLRGLPFEDGGRIYTAGQIDVTEPDDDGNGRGVERHDFAEWRDAQQSFEIFAGFYQGTINVSDGGGKPDRYDGAFMTPNAFDVLRVSAAMGRTLQTGDDAPGAGRVVVLGDPVWKNRYQADPSIVGRQIRVNGQPATVVGVMPEGFKFPSFVDVWVPLDLDLLRTTRDVSTTGITAFGRLRPDVSPDEAQAEFAGLAARQAQQYPATNRNQSALVQPFVRAFLGSEPFQLLLTMLVAVFGVLLIACVNVANLLMARTAERTKEIAIRTALGASRRRVIGQLLTEAFVLAVAGLGFGLLLAKAGIGLFNRSLVDTNPPFWIDIWLDPMVLLFAAGLALVATMASGLLPALQASRADVNDVLKDESRGSSGLRVGRMSRLLVMLEIAVSCGLLVASGLATQSVVNLKTNDYGFERDGVFTARLGLFEADYPDDRARGRFYSDLRRHLAAVPGALAVTIASSLPATGSNGATFAVEGATYATDDDYPAAGYAIVTPGFFDTFDRELVAGRDFTDADDLDAPRVIIVNQSFAARWFPSQDPLGRRIRTGRANSTAPWMEIVGVAPDLYVGGLQDETPEGYYVPVAQEPPRFASLAARAASDPMALTAGVRSAVAALNPDLPIYWVRTMAAFIEQNNWFYQVFGSLFMVFGAAALFLATVGLYGVMARSVSRRTPEFGVRMALGSSGAGVMKLVVRQGLVQIAVGLVLGLGLAAGLAQFMTIIMFGVDPWDPFVFSVVVVSLATVALLACLIPARRAMRVDPMTALRYK